MSKKSDTTNQLVFLQKVGAGVLVLLAVALFMFMKDRTYPITLGYLAKDGLASQLGGTVLAPATHILFDLSLRGMAAIILVLSALYYVLSFTKYRTKYGRDLKASMSTMRWLYLAITWGLSLEMIALVSGINDFLVLKLMGGLIFTSMILAMIAERENKGTKKPVKLTFGMSVITGIMPWFMLIASALGTIIYGMERTAWYVYVLQASLLIPLITLWLNQWRQYRRVGAWKDYVFADRNYIVIDLAAKIALTPILIIGLHR